MKRAANQKEAAKKNGGAPPAPKRARKVRPPRVEIDAAIARRLAEIETLKAAKKLIEIDEE